MASDPEPIVKHIYIADPSAHSFNDRIYIYPSHDRENDIPDDDHGSQYDMVDYHVISLPHPHSPPQETIDHGIALSLPQIPWATSQLWAPDALYSPHTKLYHLFFPARNSSHQFQIGVASSPSPSGPFTPSPNPIPGSFSIDPCSFLDPSTNEGYLYFGGIWGGQLQCYQSGSRKLEDYDPAVYGDQEPKGEGQVAILPRVGKLSADMERFEGDVREVEILAPETGKLIAADDHARRFFEASWMHVYKGVYYFSYSTGDTHFVVYATGDNPSGPFTYRGRLLEPVVGWTTHHSIVEHQGRWWLFYHDSSLSGGRNHLRSTKVREIGYDERGDMFLVEKQG